jgi:hypothetical protein
MRRPLAVACALLAALPALGGELRPLGPGTIEASGGTRVPAGDGLLFVDDGQPGQVTWMRFGNGGAPELRALPLGGQVIDPEGITSDGTWVYVVGSQSRGGAQGADLARFRFDAGSGAVSGLETLNGLPELLAGVVPTGAKKKKGGLNIEGLAWDASRQRLLLGLRSPLDGGDALVVPLAIGAGPLRRESLKVEAPVRVALGGSGIRSIEQHPDGGFLIVAGGVAGARDFRLLSWDGTGAPRALTAFPDALKPEGVARVPVDGQPATVVLGDSGRYTVLD